MLLTSNITEMAIKFILLQISKLPVAGPGSVIDSQV